MNWMWLVFTCVFFLIVFGQYFKIKIYLFEEINIR
jgi:hypothetical protein